MSPTAPEASLDPELAFAAAREDILAGRGDAAEARLRALMSEAGSHPVLQYWLAAAQGAAGDWAGFSRTLAEAQDAHALAQTAAIDADAGRIETDPDYAVNVGQAFYQHGHVAVASACFRRAVQAGADATALLSLGLSLQHQGRIEEAVGAFTFAHQSNPTWAAAHSFLLYSLFFAEDGVRRHAEAARRWRQLYGQAPPPRAFANPDLDGRPLKVGYVVPSLDSQVRQRIVPILQHHDRSQVHSTLYLQAPPSGETPADEVRAIGGLSDAAAADLIASDGIDLLVDLWGHTANGRLGVFVHKPAPVQASWLNYVQTTGVPEIDYLIHADSMKVPNAQDHCAETIWYLGPFRAPFRPDARPDPTPTPALANGYVTFGSYNHPARLNDQTLAAWARILKEVPGSRLLLRYRFYVDEVLQNATLMRFAARGVDPDRIVFGEMLKQPAYYQSYGEIDLALDPSPCPGGTTSSDAVANGVPVLTMAGQDYYSRLGLGVIQPLGLDELIAYDWDGYVDRAVALTSDLQALNALRAEVRTRFDSSGRRDEAGFTRHLEKTFREMFRRWRQGRTDRPAA